MTEFVMIVRPCLAVRVPALAATMALLFGTVGVFAQGDAALARADAEVQAIAASADVRSAQLDLQAAVRELARSEADPTTLRVAMLRARHHVESELDAVHNAEWAARDAAADAFEAALEAGDTVAIAEAAVAIARTEAEAARIREEAGAATTSDVARAADAARRAERDLRDAQRGLDLALDRLRVRLGWDGPLPPLHAPAGVPTVPAREEALARTEENAALRSAGRAVELAQAQLAAVDVAFTVPRADVEAARDALASAELRVTDLASALELNIGQAFNAVLAAEARLASADEALASAEEDVQVALARFEAGSVAQVTLERARLERMRRDAERRSALHALADAVRSLDAVILGAGQ